MDAMRAPDTIVLVEGESDRLALLAVARRLERDLGGAGVELRSMHGVTNLRRHLRELGAFTRAEQRVLGLYDANELQQVARTLADAGLTVHQPPTLSGLERVGFFACVRDLEDEAIRAASVEQLESALAASGDLSRFRTFQAQPAQRERTLEAQLHRFAGTAGGRKARFAVDIIDTLAVERMPRPLVAVLEAAMQPAAAQG